MINLNLTHLRTFVTIADSKSLNQAARKLNRTASTLSYQLAELEKELGQKLFERVGRHLELTPFGAIVREEAEILIGVAQAGCERLTFLSQGGEHRIRLAVSDLIAPDRIVDLLAASPERHRLTEIIWSTEVLMGAWDALASKRADLAIGVTTQASPPGEYRLHPIGTVEFLFVMSPDHPLAREPEPLTPNLVRPYRAVAAMDSSRGLPARSFGILPGQLLLRVPNQHVKRLAILAGLGIGHLPRHLIQADLAQGLLVTRQATHSPKEPTELYTAFRAEDPHEPGRPVLSALIHEIIDRSRTHFWFA
ncbi:MAG: LysR substrate-binding domain-containing protein [Gammaproteobacteria bacterium]